MEDLVSFASCLSRDSAYSQPFDTADTRGRLSIPQILKNSRAKTSTKICGGKSRLRFDSAIICVGPRVAEPVEGVQEKKTFMRQHKKRYENGLMHFGPALPALPAYAKEIILGWRYNMENSGQRHVREIKMNCCAQQYTTRKRSVFGRGHLWHCLLYCGPRPRTARSIRLSVARRNSR